MARRFLPAVPLLAAPPSGDTGWDVFALTYHVEAPLNAVISAAHLEVYNRLFSFLWRLKRVEFTLSNTWCKHMMASHKLRVCACVRARTGAGVWCSLCLQGAQMRVAVYAEAWRCAVGSFAWLARTNRRCGVCYTGSTSSAPKWQTSPPRLPTT